MKYFAYSSQKKFLNNLKKLILNGNTIGPKGVEWLSKAAKFMVNLTGLGLPGVEIGTKAECLTRFSSIKALDLRENRLSPEDIRILSESDEFVSKIEVFYLKGNNISLGVRYLKKFTNLQILDLRRTGIDIEGLETLSYVVESMPDLKEIYLGDNDIDQEGIQQYLPKFGDIKLDLKSKVNEYYWLE